ncbi:4-methyl-5(b-hydroxyethyl)-thiazole monophosphate biosynthesis [Keratinibaculum paraultunense]|uniref:4-methyl-5(B-hydroxyethyl)-thiazole monophosphate biosynthesis n=1 Tax=Keratinibaculum paraultunense TaxID=1278232 RepID=A0A4R3KSZ5_9FIRM|nr:DJ-1 family glyoxalase III [Keratinibaculum paraultunense]QQY79588.1 DJ-1/PfpI family protein [Keratinibaculum paraultunense]TCS87611.1 4-methyl-5(b-hydroxyethyl)-thiazole monophosphate biosynthesis [Keratinibaculum paraultunense]
MKRVIVFLAEGFEEVEAFTVVDYLRRKDIVVDTCSIGEKNVQGAHKIIVEADKKIDEINNSNDYDGLVIPGGIPGATNLRDDERVIKLVKEFNEEGKIIAAICAGPIVLQRAGIIKGKKVTSYPGFEEDLKESIYKEDLVVQDGNIITARGPAVAVCFAMKLVENLIGKEKASELRKEILLDMVEESIKNKK